jgi:hypothetical protein
MIQSILIKLSRLPYYGLKSISNRNYRLELIHYWYCGKFSNYKW